MSYPQTTFGQTAFTGPSLLSSVRNTVSRTTFRTQLDQIKSTGRYDCFKLKWHSIYEDKSMWPVPFHLFWDSDIAKWIEGACYFLQESYDAELDTTVKELVEMIRGAQQDDGYLNVHYTVVEPDKKWSNLRDMHELYNAGHLIEAAIAHTQYYENDLLVDPLKRYIALIHKKFGPADGQLKGYPGHPEIELALLRFYAATHHRQSYDLAKYFLTERGNPKGQDGKHYYDYEAELRNETPWKRPDCYPENRAYWYNQAHTLIKDQPTIEGHSVRAMYLLTAVADLVALSDSPSTELERSEKDTWIETLRRLWANMVDKKMYITGGIGAIKQWEGFGLDYFLPQGTDEGGCYAETCASIGIMMLAERMLHIDLDSSYADIMELCLYNNVMTSMSTDGKKFTYDNQLASSEQTKSVRNDWFWCACCPPNVTRLYGSIGGYLWDQVVDKDHISIIVHLYTTAELNFKVSEDASVKLRQESNWPWEGKVSFELSVTGTQLPVTLRLRLPAWCKGGYALEPAAQTDALKIENGYIVLDSAYLAQNPRFSLDIKGFEPRYLSPHPYTNQNTLALARGPIVYCAEDVDNTWETNHFKDVVLKMGSPVTEVNRRDEQSGNEYVELRTKCWTRSSSGVVDDEQEARELVLVPYYFRCNRGGNGQMRVGMVNGSGRIGNVFPEKQ